MTTATTWRAQPSCRLTELPDETGVILHLDKKFYFTLNAAAVVVWKRLADRAVVDADKTAEALAAHLTTVFEVDEPTARADVDALLDELQREGLVVDGGAPGRTP